ncbi:MAG: glycoside hydrolase [Ruminococcaceae bacterium]|nr:glycoside hydrolase [Oscillospiraceae bacterium]
MLKREEIRIRDPFILPDPANNCYYMYGTTALKEGSISATNTFSVYKTYDLENFEDPIVVMDPDTCGFWGEYDFWAPEVHIYRGKYYLFGSCKAKDKCRATQIFVSDTPTGAFLPLSETARTPVDWECLDGTLWIEDGVPYFVFCHEWLQVRDGEIWAMPMTEDLAAPKGAPFLLFRASDNPYVTECRPACYVTDGPFLFSEGGKLKMIWSSFYEGRYLVLEAESDGITAPWTHFGSRFAFDGGHAMLFERLDGTRMISLHSPNKAGRERAQFFPY